MAEVWADPYYGQGDKVKLLVALSIADCARTEDGKAWPSIESIARKSRTSVRGAQEAIREMQKDNKVKVDEAAGPHGTNVYILCIPPHSVHPAQRAPRKRAPEKRAEIPAEKAPPVCTQSIRNNQEPSLTVSTHPPETPPVPADKPPGNHAALIALWTEEYPRHHGGQKYAFQAGKDGLAVKQVLATSKLTPEELRPVFIAAWKHPKGFYCKMAASLSGFNSKFNEIREELRTLSGGTNEERTFRLTSPGPKGYDPLKDP